MADETEWNVTPYGPPYVPLSTCADPELDTIAKAPDTESDEPVVTALQSRARDLSMAISNPSTLARKLRESLVEMVGPDAAVAYHLSAAFDGEKVNFQIARLGPRLLTRIQVSDRHAEIAAAYHTTTQGGWRIAVGVQGSVQGFRFDRPEESNVKAEFSVTVSR